MNIMLIARGIPDRKSPLYGIFEFDQARALADAGHTVTVLSADIRSIRRKRKWGFSHGTDNGVNWYTLNVPVGAVPLGMRSIIGSSVLKRLYRRVIKEIDKPDIIHAHFTVPGYTAAKLAEMIDVPLVITEHSSKLNQNPIPADHLKLARKTYPHADCLIAVSHPLANSIKRETGVEPVIIPNIVNAGEFRSHGVSGDGCFRFVSTGNLIKRKCTDNIIAAFSALSKRYPDTRLEIIGDGPERDALRAQADSAGLSERITFHGQLFRRDMADVYGTCNCFVLASATETFGVVLIEAMAAGLPVIATRSGGPESFIDEKSGLLIPVNDTAALTDAMEHMIIHGNDFDRQYITEHATIEYSAARIAGRLEAVYRTILNGKHKDD